MSTYFYKQTWAFPEGLVVKARSHKGGSVLSPRPLKDPAKDQSPLYASFVQSTKPVFVLGKGGYHAVRGQLVRPEDDSPPSPAFV